MTVSRPAQPTVEMASDNWRLPLRWAWLTVFAFFGIAVVWGIFARLDEAATAEGVVANKGNLRAIQHLEGGIVRELLVHDGDLVQEGQVLLRLEPTQAMANESVARSQLAAALALEARLSAERDGRAEILFPDEVMAGSKDPNVSRAIGDQLSQFRERRVALEGQVGILEARLKQLAEERIGLRRLRTSAQQQADKIEEELKGLRELASKRLIPATRVYAMEREAARMAGDVGKSDADIAKNDQMVGETRLQIDQANKQFQESVGKEIIEVRKQIGELRDKLSVVADVLRRIEIHAPVAGTVQNLKFFTIGGVVRPADNIMEISPSSDTLVVRAQINPDEIDAVKVGDSAEITFPAFSTRRPPLIYGQLSALSRDRLTNDQDKKPYFAAEVTVDTAGIPPYFRSRIIPGMRANAIIATGERTVIDYLIGPIRQRFRGSMHER